MTHIYCFQSRSQGLSLLLCFFVSLSLCFFVSLFLCFFVSFSFLPLSFPFFSFVMKDKEVREGKRKQRSKGGLIRVFLFFSSNDKEGAGTEPEPEIIMGPIHIFKQYLTYFL